MAYSFEYRPSFLRDVKRLKRKGCDLEKLNGVLHDLAQFDRKQLARKYRNHALKGELKGYQELHVEGDWLLVYQVVKKRMCLR